MEVFGSPSSESAASFVVLAAAAPDMQAALLAVYRVARPAMLPGPVYLSIAEVEAWVAFVPPYEREYIVTSSPDTALTTIYSASIRIT